ncbi:MAG: MBL fold metallo-hydrolase [Sedimentibacter sp.]|uniref:MBL fold metallo-hydrolase n=1 Tax=Sedimentibacter sp. TaxID=1960295 RepID=UPI00298299A4|nr:MBL fold metallo-hydrolase [Sedimentibacter sp.]MDW5299246.1 MBL fold metallo-hydrolase [Sedimentibacter sp.]
MIIKLTDRIYFMPHNVETDRPILGYIKGDQYSLMVDAGNSKKHVDEFMDGISKLGLPYPNFVAITHSHWDHTYGLFSVNAVSIACKKTNEYLNEMSSWEWTDEAMDERLKNGEDIEFCDTMIRKEYYNRKEICVKTADIVFDEKLSLDLGNISCELLKLDSSHAEDCVVAYVPKEKILFIGDIISEDFHHGEPVYYKDKLYSLIKTFKELDFETALFGHMEPFAKKDLISWLENLDVTVI